MFCSKCGAEIKANDEFCSKCGKRTDFGEKKEKVQASSSNQKQQEHILAKAEISWAPILSWIIWAVILIALYFLFETCFIAPKFREITIAIKQNENMYFSMTDVEEQVNTILNFIRIPFFIIIFISVILNFLVRVRQFLYVTNKRIIGNTGHIFWVRSLNLPLSQVKELRIDKAFSIIPHTTILVNRTYDFQIKEGQEFRLLLERLVREANSNKNVSTSSPSVQQNPPKPISSTVNRVNTNTWICGKCGAHNSNSDSFCNDCGNYK